MDLKAETKATPETNLKGRLDDGRIWKFDPKLGTERTVKHQGKEYWMADGIFTVEGAQNPNYDALHGVMTEALPKTEEVRSNSPELAREIFEAKTVSESVPFDSFFKPKPTSDSSTWVLALILVAVGVAIWWKRGQQ